MGREELGDVGGDKLRAELAPLKMLRCEQEPDLVALEVREHGQVVAPGTWSTANSAGVRTSIIAE
jgi:hypothetical protein